MNNVIDLSAFKGARSSKHSEDHEPIGPRVKVRRRSGQSLHTFVFRSYELIVESTEADLVRDVRLDTGKAQTKLRKIREQIAIDREQAAVREKLLTSAEKRLSEAIDATRPLAAGKVEP